ncbi:MAG: 50S ribosomal protein L22 [Methanobacteriota archaeon]
MAYGYSVHPDPEATAIASGRSLPVSPRDAVNVCRAIRGRSLTAAKDFLEGVIEERVAVPYFRHLRNQAHRRGKVGPGAFPRKCAEAILGVLQNAENNAEYKGLDVDRMVVHHAAAHKAGYIPGMMPKAHGSSGAWNTSLSHIEIVLAERPEGAPHEEAPAKADAEKEGKKEVSKAKKAGARARAKRAKKQQKKGGA